MMCTAEIFEPKENHIVLSEDEILDAVSVLQLKKKSREADRAITKLTTQFYPYIYKTALKASPTTLEDSITAGLEGLVYAAQHFDKNAGTKFITYAFLCIYGYIYRDKRDTRVIKLSNNVVNKFKNSQDKDDEIKFKNVSSLLSLNAHIGNEESSESKDYLEYLSDGNEEEKVIEDVYNKKIYARMKSVIYNNRNKENDLFSDIYCHSKGLFDKEYIPLKTLLNKYSLDERFVRSKFKNIDDRLRRDEELRKLLAEDGRVPKQRRKRDTSIWANINSAYYVAKNGQLFFNIC